MIINFCNLIYFYQITDPAVDAILGHKSAASLATGPVI